MFERPNHQRVASVLASLDAELLASKACLFGGGTAIALRHGEYRESVDIDFLMSDLAGYRDLRQRMSEPHGLKAIARPNAPLQQVRELRADQYGIRTLVQVDGVPIKFEIVLEARIALSAPGAEDRVAGIATLTPIDLAASKLLANSDRWRDDSVFSRDLIDLAMMDLAPKLRAAAADKARNAYGDGIDADLGRAIAMLRERPQRLGQCMAALQMAGVPKALLWKRIKALLP